MSCQIASICVMNCSIALQSVHSYGIQEIATSRKLTIFALKPSRAFELYITSLIFKRRIKSHLPFAGIISSSSYSPRFQDKG